MFSWLQYSNELLQKEFLYPLYSNNESNAVKVSERTRNEEHCFHRLVKLIYISFFTVFPFSIDGCMHNEANRNCGRVT